MPVQFLDSAAVSVVQPGSMSLAQALPNLQRDLSPGALSLEEETTMQDIEDIDEIGGDSKASESEAKFDAMDLNRDGKVTADELMQALATNQDGSIDRDEFKAGAAKIAPRRSRNPPWRRRTRR